MVFGHPLAPAEGEALKEEKVGCQRCLNNAYAEVDPRPGPALEFSFLN